MSNYHKEVKVESSDNKIFEVDESGFCKFTDLKPILDLEADGGIRLPEISSETLDKVITYCKYHVESEKSAGGQSAIPEDEIKQWDADFVKVDRGTLVALVKAADFLHINSLLNLTSAAIAGILNHKSVGEMRQILGIENDFTPEEEEEIRQNIKRERETSPVGPSTNSITARFPSRPGKLSISIPTSLRKSKINVGRLGGLTFDARPIVRRV